MTIKKITLENSSNTDIKRFQTNPESFRLSDNLNENINFFNTLAGKDKTVKTRIFIAPENNNIRAGIVYIDGLVSELILNQNIIGPILTYRHPTFCKITDTPFNLVYEKILFSGDIVKSNDMQTIFNNLLVGNTLLFVDGTPEAILISTKGWEVRSVTEPEAEKVITGPHEGFNESIIHNLALLRRKITNPQLKYEFFSVGKKTNTNVCICYMNGLADKRIIADLRHRINSIDIDCVLDTEYIQEIIKDGRYSLFKTTGSTQRPDVAAAKIMEGRIVLMINGSPVAATIPFVFIEYFQAADDYYSDAYYASFNRLLRLFGFFMTISLPGIYLSFITYHQEMLPLKFLMSAAQSRNGMPLSSFIEIILLIFTFEIIREGSSKIPSSIGTAFSIVGGIVLGQAAVEAKFVSLPIVIIVAFSCLTGLIVPELRGPAIFLRFILLVLARMMGMFGYMIGLMIIIFMICGLESFSIPYSSLTSRNIGQTVADTFIRMPWPKMKKRPLVSNTEDITRQR